MTLVGACPQTVTPISIPLKQEPVPHHLTLFFCVFTKITLSWNVVKPWTIDIGLWCYQEDIKKNPMKEQELNKDYLQPEQMVC